MKIKKEILPRTSMPISIKLGTNHPSVKKIKNCTNTVPVPLHLRKPDTSIRESEPWLAKMVPLETGNNHTSLNIE
jgi:hypothetical protein